MSLLAQEGELGQAHAMAPLPWRAAAPEILACAMVTLAALVLAYIGLRRSVTSDERARALQHQLAAEREARRQSDQALADNHDLLYRLVRQHEGVRAGERSRIGAELRAGLERRLLHLRNEMAGLQASLKHDAGAFTLLASGLDCALANLDASIQVVRAVAGGLGGSNPGEGLRHALERCLADYADSHGLRYRFEAGVDPRACAGTDRAARLAVFRVLQDVLAGAARMPGDGQGRELHVRLLEGASTLGLEIDGCSGPENDLSPLSLELRDQIRAMGGVLRRIASAERRTRWTLSVPVRDGAPAPLARLPASMAEVA